jgi:uncharacterized small protein (DUF1192 family)
MMFDDLEPQKVVRQYVLGSDITCLSVMELEQLAHQLDAEKQRVLDMASSKKASKSAAEMLFASRQDI